MFCVCICFIFIERIKSDCLGFPRIQNRVGLFFSTLCTIIIKGNKFLRFIFLYSIILYPIDYVTL